MRTLVLGLVCAVLASCGGGGGEDEVAVRFDLGDEQLVVRAEVADDPTEQARGLMGRRSLGRDRGMLFVFDEPTEHRFWMKDTLIPLDLISIRAGRVVAVDRLVPCRTARCPTTLTPKIDAALEVAAGTAKRAGIVRGTPVSAVGLL